MSSHRLSGARILLVEDNSDLTPSFRRMLELHKAEVAICASAPAVRKYLIDLEATSTMFPTVILMDYSLVGNESGIALARWLFSQPSFVQIPRVLLTGMLDRARQEVQELELEQLFVAVYQKPIPMEPFLTTIEGLIPSSRVVP